MTTGARRESENNNTASAPEDDDPKQSLVENVLSEQVSKLQLTTTTDTNTNLFLCDAGYGLPLEARPRREKILAICRQLYNFIKWQMSEECTGKDLARVKVVGSSLEVVTALEERLQQLFGTNSAMPSHVEFCSEQALNDYCINDDDTVYLSPDATTVLDASQKPPSTVVVGLLIDRRTIQFNRSQKRACILNVKAARLPLDELCFSNMDKHEPLNVDTVMEGMQQWWWNCEAATTTTCKECFVQAATQAIERHCQRHFNRPLHKTM